MIAFDTTETLFFNVGIETFSILVLGIVYFGSGGGFADDRDNRLLRQNVLFITFTLFADICTWLINGKPGNSARFIGYLANSAYFLLQLVVAREWLRYAYYRVYLRKMAARTETLVMNIPFMVMGAITLTSPFTRLVFYLDAANYYHRGVITPVFSVITLGYLMSASVMAISRRGKEVLYDRKNELRTIGFFAVFPLLGGTVQTIVFGCTVLWPCVTLSILIIFINRKNREVSQDPLTGMNNRGRLDRYLQTYAENGEGNGVTLIMADINFFKKINDRFGHDMGDSALVRMADILRSTFRGEPVFLSRYGGDEFVIVLAGTEAGAAEEAISRIRRNLEDSNREDRYPYTLSVSLGYAVSRDYSSEQAKDVLIRADRNMYLDKQKYHKAGNRSFLKE